MKNFLLALFLLAAVLTLSLVNAHYVRAEISAMQSLLSASDGGKAVYDRLCEDEFLLSLSSNHLLIEQAMQCAIDLSCLEKSPGSTAEAEAARSKLRLALSEIENGEKCNFSGLF